MQPSLANKHRLVSPSCTCYRRGAHLLCLDRFKPIIHGCHLTGAIYFTVLNNPREVRQLRSETYLCMTLPGPHEPNQQQLNKVMFPVVDNMKKLNHG